MSEPVYNENFYKDRNRDTEYAAIKILNLVLNRLPRSMNSMVDVGCGVGTWLRAARTQYNFEIVVGVDGDYVPRQYLQIEEKCFMPADLENYCVEKVKKWGAVTKFDIAICLEVAEHIGRRNARAFIHKLCELSDIIVFSAAVPKQGGDAHINEQRLSYWVNLFGENNYQLYDLIRAEIWNDIKIPVWYRSNIVIFCNRKIDNTIINTENAAAVMDMVHPDMFETKMKIYERQIKEMQENYNLKKLLKGELCKIVERIKNFR